tara:strand:+ start:220 stop:1143 length:924 start_codon:yes stop_codon:yes gene_type:complete
MKVLITGGAGFIGFNLIKALKNNLDYEKIICFDNLSSKTINHNYFGKNVKFINDDLTNINDYKELKNVDIIFHLAAKGNVIDSVQNPIDNFNSNVFETFKLLEFVRLNGINKLIFSSTGGAIMGNVKPPVNEKNIPSPISPYGASKLACEAYLRAYSSSYNIKCTCLRFGNVYGPYSSHKKGVINKFIKAFKANKSIEIFGDGNSSRDYIFVEDIVHGLIKSCQFLDKSEDNFSIFHLASGKETKLNELVLILERISGKIISKEYYPSRIGEVVYNFADYSLAKKVLGFNPSISIENGLEILYKSLK